MIGTWYTLRALAAEWNASLVPSRLIDAFSASRDELTLLLELEGRCDALRISVLPGNRYVFRQPDAARPRRNVTTLFESVLSRTVDRIEVADRDRVLDLALSDGSILRAILFGPRANVLVVRPETGVISSFRSKIAAEGDVAPAARQAPDPIDTVGARERWPGESMTLERAVARTWPLFDDLLAAEVVSRAALGVHDACLVGDDDLERVVHAADAVRARCLSPEPTIYRSGRSPVAFSLLPLAGVPAPAVESFASVDAAVRSFVRGRLAEAAFRSEFDPLVRVLETAAERNRVRVERMEAELAEPSRAERWERYGHLLMTIAGRAGAGHASGETAVAVADVFEDGAAVDIPLDPALSIVDNARSWYERARNTRRSRDTAQERLRESRHALDAAGRMLTELRGVADRDTLRTFRTRYAADLGAFGRERPADAPAVPFRRFDLGAGFEAWVGRSARENDELTFRHARKHDLWLHARGVPGSHVVLRNPQRGRRPPRAVIEAAAAIAARFSKASGSEFVPVIVAERRHVRKPRGADPGAVVVEREEVVLVEPMASPH